MSAPRKSNRTSQRIAKKQLDLRAKIWPDLNQSRLWNRKNTAGFISIPRAMPLILRVMDELSSQKPVSRTYLDLWCRAFDECFVTITNPSENAFFAGFTGQRAETTWRRRMHRLVELGFIDAKPGTSGAYHYVLLWIPIWWWKDLLLAAGSRRPPSTRCAIGCSTSARRTSDPRFDLEAIPRCQTPCRV